MRWSPEQDAALKRVSAWLRDGGAPQVFRLFGHAGTGKTTLARTAAQDVDGEVAFGAYTGKAASVLRSMGCPDAQTVHSLVYRPHEAEDGTVSYALNPRGAAAKASLIVVDECSMIDETLGRDLVSFGTKVLLLGDAFQLPPAGGTGFFMGGMADVLLTDVRRQARENPIIELSMMVREGRTPPLGLYGRTRVIPRKDLARSAVLEADQVLVGRVATKDAFNGEMRRLLGYDGPIPRDGERLVCLRNDRRRGLLNGGAWVVEEARPAAGDTVRLLVRPGRDDDDHGRIEVDVPLGCFDGEEGGTQPARGDGDASFGYGYAMTVHKAQGSQWESVVLLDESRFFGRDATRWLYTGVTRAAETLTLAL